MSDTTESLMWKEFLESVPPGRTLQRLNGILKAVITRSGLEAEITSPELMLYCDSSLCGGERIFKCEINTSHRVGFETEHYQQDFFFTYVCRHCQRSYKTFALRLGNPVRPNLADATKIGEWPPFGPPVPPRVITLIGPDRDLFLQGRRAENQGMGIGAFAYYRRVVENQKNHIIDEIMRVVTRLGADPAMLRDLESAKSDFRFERAIEAVKLGIPEVLKINGHNPLTLLHSALSNGLHNDSDAGCLEIATSIRVVLTELAERIDSALREKKELDEAVSRLLKRDV